MGSRVAATAKAVGGEYQARPAALAGNDFYSSTESVAFASHGADQQPVIPLRGCDVTKDTQRVVDRIGHEINTAVAIKVTQGEAAGVVNLRCEIAAARRDVRETSPAVAAEEKVVLRVAVPKIAQGGLGMDRTA